jgi:hypothetical protein
MSNATKPTKLTPVSWKALEVLRLAETPMTLAQINANSSETVASPNMTQLVRKGLVNAVKTEFVCPCCGNKTEKNVYSVTETGALYTEEA